MSQHRPPKGPGPYLVGQRPRGIRLNTQPRAYAARANLSKSRMSAAAISLTPAKSAAALSNCPVCTKSHPQKYTDCPSLILIQRREAELSVTCCAKCLGPLDQTGQCRKGGKCHLVNARSGVQYDFLCKRHKVVHFRICNSCPPSRKQAKVAGQIVARQSQGISYPCDGKRDPQTTSSRAFQAAGAETAGHLIPDQAWPPEEDPLPFTGDLITPGLFAMFQTCGLRVAAIDIKAAFRQIALDIDSILPCC